MSGSHPRPVAVLSDVLAPAYLNDLAQLELAELRERRTHCALIESSVSYERQLIQGRFDIVCDELNRRAGDVGACNTSLVERLPEILTLHSHGGGAARPPTFMFPVCLNRQREERMHQVAPARILSALPAQSTPDLLTMSRVLEAMEKEVSVERRALHEVFDRIQEEVIRRYKSGEVPIRSAFLVALPQDPDS